MKTEVIIEDYLSREEIQDIVKDELRILVKDSFRKEKLDTLIANSSYEIVWKAVDEEMDGNLIETIKTKTLDIINNLSSYSVFHKKDAWEHEDSKAYIYMQQAIEENKDLIFSMTKERIVTEIVKFVDTNYIQDCVNDLIYQIVEEKICGKSI